MSKARDLANASTALNAVSPTELGYLDGVTSAVQTQIDGKIGQSTAINPTIVDAKGDIIAATAADTVARLAVGSNDQVLMADSTAATGLKWATPASGGWASIASGSLTSTGVTISSIPSTYKTLRIIITAAKTSLGDGVIMRFNSDSGANYGYTGVNQASSAQGSYNGTHFTIQGADNTTTTAQHMVFDFPDYASTTGMKGSNGFFSRTDTATFGGSLFWENTSAISSVSILTQSGGSDPFTGGTYQILGGN